MALPTGIVIIGKDEARRLGLSLRQAKRQSDVLVYVDSNSRDNSVAIAQDLKCPVVRIDSRLSPSAARGRNEGVKWLVSHFPSLQYIQFIDGDCELSENWIQEGVSFLESHPEHGAVCGFLSEHAPEASVFNFLCALEWDRSLGEIKSCGGLAMVRITAFSAAGGFDHQLSAGEEAQLYGVMRDLGWKVERIPFPMAVHDAHILSFGEWFRRSMRGGRATYLAFRHYRGSSRNEAVPDFVRLLAWSGVGVLGLFFLARSSIWGVLLLSLFPMLFLKIAITRIFQRALSPRRACLYAFFICVEKLPRFLGMVQGFLNEALAVKKNDSNKN